MDQQIDYVERAALLKALAHPLRLRLLHGLLHTGCHNVGCMEQLTGVSQSCISQHLQKLRMMGLVSAERSGNEVYYRACSPEAARLVAVLMGEEVSSYAL